MYKLGTNSLRLTPRLATQVASPQNPEAPQKQSRDRSALLTCLIVSKCCLGLLERWCVSKLTPARMSLTENTPDFGLAKEAEDDSSIMEMLSTVWPSHDWCRKGSNWGFLIPSGIFEERKNM